MVSNVKILAVHNFFKVIADECFILFKCLFHSVRELHRFLHCRDELQRFFTSQKRGRSMIISAEESLATGG